jgi:cell division protein FtsB
VIALKNFFDNLFSAIKHYAIHVFGLALSLSAIYHTMIQFSDDPLFQKFFGIGGIFAGLSIQYLWGLSAAYRKRDFKSTNHKGKIINLDRRKANRLWCVVILCICIFDFTSSFGVIITEIDKSDQQYSALDDVRQDIEDQIEKLETEIEDKKEQQTIEFKDNKGRGPNYNQFQVEIDSAKAEVEKLKVELSQVKTEVKTVDKSTFARLGEKAGINPFWIELTMSLGLMFLIYYIPLLTPWDVRLPGENVTSVTVTPPRNAVKRPAVLHRHVTNMDDTGGMDLCQCGKLKPVTHQQCVACRVKASRDRKKGKRKGLGNTPQQV